ncbi:mRNA cap guanine-N7 methyltransferase 1 [Cardamine amara subsp. amara]|uniref:mRNA (guanine-N(7))-methyltransferase n=1 Tax=Cardamine amara subsp. amara TaxID=228776 RepID=A0ABD1BKQ4_CARAN
MLQLYFVLERFKSSSPFGIEYVSHLEDAVDYPEWIVRFNIFKALAEEYDLEFVFVKNSDEFVHEYMKNPKFVDLMRRLGALGDGNQDQSTLSADEWEAAYLYLSFVLKKRGESDQRRGGHRKNGKMNLSKDDVLYIDNWSVKYCSLHTP